MQELDDFPKSQPSNQKMYGKQQKEILYFMYHSNQIIWPIGLILEAEGKEQFPIHGIKVWFFTYWLLVLEAVRCGDFYVNKNLFPQKETHAIISWKKEFQHFCWSSIIWFWFVILTSSSYSTMMHAPPILWWYIHYTTLHCNNLTRLKSSTGLVQL